MRGRVWTLTQTEDTLWYYVYTNQSGAGGKNRAEKKDSLRRESVTAPQDVEVEAEMLRDYFQLHVKLGDLYREWGTADSHFREIADIFSGQRVYVCILLLPSESGLKYVALCLCRCANAASGPHRMPVFLHLHLQQSHLSYSGNGGEIVSGSGYPSLPAGSNLLP